MAVYMRRATAERSARRQANEEQRPIAVVESDAASGTTMYVTVRHVDDDTLAAELTSTLAAAVVYVARPEGR
jgi:hypothetical protein